MAELQSLGDVLKTHRFAERLERVIGHELPPPPTADEEPTSCERCHGSGYLRRDLPPAHPDFGKLLDCSCAAAQRNIKRRQERVWREVGVPPKMAKFTLESYAKRTGRRATADDLRAWVEAGDWLVLLGANGVGKTGLAVSMLLEQLRAGRSGFYVVAPRFLQRIRATYDNRKAAGETVDELEVLRSLIEPDWLVLDDVGVNGAPLNDWARDKLFLVVNERDLHLRRTVLTTNLTWDELCRQLGPATADRIAGRATVIELTGESLRGRKPKPADDEPDELPW